MSNRERIQNDKATILSIIKYFLFLVIAAGLILLGARLFIILLPFVFGYILARLAIGLVTVIKNKLYDIDQFIQRRRSGIKHQPLPPKDKPPRRKHGRYPQGLARSRSEKRLILIVYVVLIVLIFGMFVGIIIAGISQLRTLAAYLPEIFSDTKLFDQLISHLEGFSARLGGFIPAQYLNMLDQELTNLQQRILQEIPRVVTAILNGIASFAGHLPILFFAVVVAVMSGYYFIADSRSMYIFLSRNVTSRQFRQKTVRLVNSLFTMLFRVIGGYLLLLILTFIMALAGLAVIRMPYAIIIAIITAVVDFLPILGLTTTLIPVAAYLFINGQILQGFGALILLAIMIMIRRVIEPPILGNAMRLHPMATLAAMIIGIAIYGLGGILIGPVVLVVAREIMALYGFDKRLRRIFGDVLNRLSS